MPTTWTLTFPLHSSVTFVHKAPHQSRQRHQESVQQLKQCSINGRSLHKRGPETGGAWQRSEVQKPNGNLCFTSSNIKLNRSGLFVISVSSHLSLPLYLTLIFQTKAYRRLLFKIYLV